MNKNLVLRDYSILCCSDSFSFQFIFQSLEVKRAKPDWISSTIELMVKKDDFSKLEDVCTLVSKAIPGFQKRLQNSLKSVPDNVIENLNLDPEVKTTLGVNVDQENLEEVSNYLQKVRTYIRLNPHS